MLSLQNFFQIELLELDYLLADYGQSNIIFTKDDNNKRVIVID